MKRTQLLAIAGLLLITVAYLTLPSCDDLITETIEIPIRDNPHAEFSADVVIGCTPLTVQFTDESNGPHHRWIWDFGDGNVDSVADPVHTYEDAGVFNVKLTVIDTLYTGDNPAYQGNDSEEKPHFIITGSTIGEILLSDSTGCEGLEVTFSPTDASNVDSVRWNFGDGSPNSTEMSPTHTYADTGSYHITLTAYGECGTKTVIDSNRIRVTPCPDIYFRLDPTDTNVGCVPHTVTFYDTSMTNYTDSLGNPVGIKTRLWNFGNGQTSPAAVQQITYNNPGTYTVSLTITDSEDAVRTDSVVDYITVWDTSNANFSNVTPVSQCLNPFRQFQVIFEADYPGTLDSLIWSFGDGTQFIDSSSPPMTPMHAYVEPGKYDVTLETFGPCGNSVLTREALVVLSSDIQPDSVRWDVQPDTTGDVTTEFSFTDLTNGVVESRNWNFSGDSSTDSVAIYTFSDPGTYTVTLSVGNQCNIIDTTFNIVVADTAASGARR